MKKVLVNYGGAVAFYLLIIAIIIMVNARFTYLNENTQTLTYAYND